MKESQLFVVTGLHRGGTTYIGRVLSLINSTYVLHEPFNPVWGVEYAPPAYTYWRAGQATGSKCEQTINQVISLFGKFAKPRTNKKNFEAMRYQLIGGRQHLKWNLLKLRKHLGVPSKRIVWKDPFCTFMVDYISRQRQVKTVVMVRHPCAHFYSVDKQKWNFNVNNLLVQKKLINDYGKGITRQEWKRAKSDNLISIALLWKIMSRMLLSVTFGNPNLLVVRHEDLCRNPIVEFGRIRDHFCIPYTIRMQSYLSRTTQGRFPEGPKGDINNFYRDSRKLVNIWQEKLPLKQQRILLDVIGEDLKSFYSSI